jgi:hypothetical protein
VHYLQEEFPEDKGLKDGHCNRNACFGLNATWFNHSARKWYCAECAHFINEANPEFLREMGYPLCTKGEIPG